MTYLSAENEEKLSGIQEITRVLEEAIADDWDACVEALRIFDNRSEENVTRALVALVIKLSRRVRELEKENDD